MPAVRHLTQNMSTMLYYRLFFLRQRLLFNNDVPSPPLPASPSSLGGTIAKFIFLVASIDDIVSRSNMVGVI